MIAPAANLTVFYRVTIGPESDPLYVSYHRTQDKALDHLIALAPAYDDDTDSAIETMALKHPYPAIYPMGDNLGGDA